MSSRTLLALGSLGALLATPALAFSPGPPRPIPPNVTLTSFGVLVVFLNESTQRPHVAVRSKRSSRVISMPLSVTAFVVLKR